MLHFWHPEMQYLQCFASSGVAADPLQKEIHTDNTLLDPFGFVMIGRTWRLLLKRMFTLFFVTYCCWFHWLVVAANTFAAVCVAVASHVARVKTSCFQLTFRRMPNWLGVKAEW